MVHELKISINGTNKPKLAEIREVMLEALSMALKNALNDPTIIVHASLTSSDSVSKSRKNSNNFIKSI